MATQLNPGKYSLDTAGSSVRFHHKGMWGLQNVNGVFGTIRGTGEITADGSGKGTLSLESASLDTKNPRRDTHLRSKDFFDAERFPEATFDATLITAADDGTATVQGELTIRGTSKKLSFPARVEAQDTDAVVLRGSVQIDRAEFGMTWNQLGMLRGIATVELELRFTAAS